MIFTHNLLQRRNLNRIDADTGRRYEVDDKSYESVTTWLGRISDKSYLDEWKKNIGEAEANKITKRAGARGSRLHESVEQYLLNNDVDVKTMPLLDKILFKPFTKILDENVNNVRALEYPLYSHSLKLAGTVDCVADYKGIPSIIDFKTTRQRKSKEDIESYFLQTTIYSIMIEEMYGVRTRQLVILMAEDGANKVHTFVEDRKPWALKLIAQLKQYPPKR